ncbi:hypothetical protein [Microcella humidisoli]|uniref:Uncharacterized protein n=1 Tax=Microcella humidisoli TaxID=2963406 RepID=A0ABY5FW41_9MICO|nr:hypothetical protein [Microcella humidisoli]UTT62105.1 hypothetical protein NNL39_10595 [Microcella humidisoli]
MIDGAQPGASREPALGLERELSDAELARRAYGRTGTPLDELRAAAAADELARRRAAEAAALERRRNAAHDAARGAASDTADGSPTASASTGDAPSRVRPWYRRPIAAVAALLVLVAGGAAVDSIVRAPGGEPAALTLLEQAPSALEQQHTIDLVRASFRTPSGARIIDRFDPLDVVGFTSESPSFDGATVIASVCTAIIRERVVLDWLCVDAEQFADSGLRATFATLDGVVQVRWPPDTEPAASLDAPEAAAPSILDLIVTEQLVRRIVVFEEIAQTGDELTAGPVVVGETTTTRVLMYQATAADIDDGQRLCLMAEREEPPFDAVCAPQSFAERDGLQLSFVDGDQIVDVRVSAEGIVRLVARDAG